MTSFLTKIDFELPKIISSTQNQIFYKNQASIDPHSKFGGLIKSGLTFKIGKYF